MVKSGYRLNDVIFRGVSNSKSFPYTYLVQASPVIMLDSTTTPPQTITSDLMHSADLILTSKVDITGIIKSRFTGTNVGYWPV